MRVVFTGIAKQELDDATHYYEREGAVLGRRFREEVRKAAARIAAYPEGWSTERGDVRKCMLHRFPYKLLYSIEADYVLVLAVAHQHRKPGYWVGRNKP